MSVNEHIAWPADGSQSDPTEKPSVPVDILSNRYFKNTLRIDYKKTSDMFLWTLWIEFGITFCVVVIPGHNAPN